MLIHRIVKLVNQIQLHLIDRNCNQIDQFLNQTPKSIQNPTQNTPGPNPIFQPTYYTYTYIYVRAWWLRAPNFTFFFPFP